MRAYLKKAREDCGYAQARVAKWLGVSQNYYCYIENGTRQKNIKAATLLKLSEILKIPINDMLENEKLYQKHDIKI